MGTCKSLMLLCAAATAAILHGGCASEPGGNDGGGGTVAGGYTVIYERLESNSNCTPGVEDPDWIGGILQIMQTGDSLSLDFGQGYVVDAATLAGDAYSFAQALTDSAGLMAVAGYGAFETSNGTLFIQGAETGLETGIVADYDTSCRVRGTYRGRRLEN